MKKSDLVTTKYIPIGKLLAGEKFNSFNKLKARANKLVKPYRDDWLTAVLIKNSIFVNSALMPKREMVEIFEKHQITLIDESGVYRVYQADQIIGEWDNSRTIRFNKNGQIQVKIQYIII